MHENRQMLSACLTDTFKLSAYQPTRHWNVTPARLYYEGVPPLEDITAARRKAEATRLRNLLSKEAHHFVLSRNESRILKRLLEKRNTENSFVAESFQFRMRAIDGGETAQTSH